MSRDWTQEELQNASKAMKAAGHLGYEEFCEQLDKTIFTAYCKDAENNLIKISGPYNCKEELEKQLQEHFSLHRWVKCQCFPVCYFALIVATSYTKYATEVGSMIRSILCVLPTAR